MCCGLGYPQPEYDFENQSQRYYPNVLRPARKLTSGANSATRRVLHRLDVQIPAHATCCGSIPTPLLEWKHRTGALNIGGRIRILLSWDPLQYMRIIFWRIRLRIGRCPMTWGLRLDDPFLAIETHDRGQEQWYGGPRRRKAMEGRDQGIFRHLGRVAHCYGRAGANLAFTVLVALE